MNNVNKSIQSICYVTEHYIKIVNIIGFDNDTLLQNIIYDERLATHHNIKDYMEQNLFH